MFFGWAASKHHIKTKGLKQHITHFHFQSTRDESEMAIDRGARAREREKKDPPAEQQQCAIATP
jgi:hypothetical protein